MKKLVFLFAIIISCCSCSPIVHKQIIRKMPAVDRRTEVTVYYVGDVVPENAEVIGGITVTGNGGDSNCGWEAVIETAKSEARNAGGNGLEITRHYFPGQNGNPCHQIAGYILYIDDERGPIELSEMAQKSFQDRVVTKNGDTIPCQILEVTQNRIVFLYARNGIARVNKSPSNDFQSYFIKDPQAYNERQKEIRENKARRNYHVQLALNGGWSIRTAPFSKDIGGDYKDYLKKLSNAPDFGASLRINLSEGFNLGLHFDRYTRSNQGYFGGYVDGDYIEGIVRNRHTIDFYALSFGMLSCLGNNWRHMLSVEFYLGYMGYKDNAEEFGLKYTLSGKALGYGVGFGYDYRLTKHIAIGTEFSFVHGAISTFLYDDGVNKRDIDLGNSKEGLGRINMKAGLRFYL